MTYPTAKIGDLAEQIRGVSYKKEDTSNEARPGFLPVLRAGNITEFGLSYNDLVYVSDKYISEKQKIRKGDVIVAASSGSIDVVGKAAPAHSDYDGSFGAFCKLLRPSRKVNPRYFAHFFKTKEYRKKVSQLAAGANINNLRNEHIDEMCIPLPSPTEQERIANILDKVETLGAKYRESIIQIDSLAQSIFFEMFGDPVTNPKEWDTSLALGDVSEVVSGITKGRKANGQTMRTVPYLAVLNVQDKELNLSTVKTIEATEGEIKRYKINKDDLLLTEGGDPDKLGRGTLWNNELPECIHQNHVFRVRLTSPKVLPLFLNWLVGSQRGKRYFLKSAKQTTGIATINMTQLKGFPLLAPPIDLQRSFVDRMQSLQKLKETFLLSATRTSELFTALQQRSFRGEL